VTMARYSRNDRYGQYVRRQVLLPIVLASLLNFSAAAFDQSAPFGFSWGPIDKVPTPSLATRHANITLLIYRRDRLPSDEIPDTEEIVLQVCKKEGLQQIIWISNFLSDSEEHAKLGSILEEATRRYGKAEVSEGGIIHWNRGQTMLAAVSNDQGLHRIFMASSGPRLDTCSEEHGHPVSDHWMQLLPHSEAQ
jgi:hypothetical protein